MIDDSIQKSMSLLSEADKLAQSMADAQLKKGIARTIKNLQFNKLDYDSKRLIKRKDSWKDITHLQFVGYGAEVLEDQIAHKGRARSRETYRGG